MNKYSKVVAHFLLPGTLFPEEVVREVSREVAENPGLLTDIPEHAYEVQFVETEYVEDGGEVYRGKSQRLNTGRIFLGGQLFNAEELAAREGKDSILYCNVFGYDDLPKSDYTHAIKCVAGNWQAFNAETDKII